jgi:DNA-directed RNA polymerase subunit M/transcription elongation factor TFIIS
MLDTSFGILESPLRPPLFGRCPKCHWWLVFYPVRAERSAISGTVTTCRCSKCGHEEKFAAKHPPRAI